MTDNIFKLKTRSQLHKTKVFQRALIRKVDVYYEVTTVSGEKLKTKSLTVALRAIAEYFDGLDPKPKSDCPKKVSKSKKARKTKSKRPKTRAKK